MKKLVLLSLPFLVLSLTASAATITWNCPTTGSLQGLAGQSASNTAIVSCTTVDAAAPGGSTFSSVQLNFALDFTFNSFDAGTKSTIWALNPPGTGLDASGIIVNSANRPVTGSTASVLAADLALYSGLGTGPVNFPAGSISYVGASTAVTGGTADMQIILTYTTATGGVPEPSTFALLGSALVGIGLIARRKR